MNPVLNFPSDEFAVGTSLDIDLAADFLELSAFYSKEGQSFSEDIVNALELAAEAEYDDVDEEVKNREEVAASAVARMAFRKQVLATSYPFDIDANGDVIFFTGEKDGPGSYRLSCVADFVQFEIGVPSIGGQRHASHRRGSKSPAQVLSILGDRRCCGGGRWTCMVFWLSPA